MSAAPGGFIDTCRITRERDFLIGLADACFQLSPDEPPWQWAGRKVWLDEKMTPTPCFYDIERTPWARKWHELPLRPETREAYVLKSSRSSFTETALNIMRWMPEHWPGNTLFAINSRDQAKKVSRTRLLRSLERILGDKLSDNPKDTSTFLIALNNMDMVVSGSGAAGPFMETWYRFICLDELENHDDTTQETTTVDRSRSRLVGVADGKIFCGSKPELAGGPIDLHYIRGTQEKWMVPCPRCGRRIELLLAHLRFSHCKELGGWDLNRVLAETFYECQLCHKPIYEKEKRPMVIEGQWEPMPADRRRKPPSGKVVRPEPGVESYQITDLYSAFPEVAWGVLAKEWLSAFVIEPNESRKKYVMTNHFAEPFAAAASSLEDHDILALRVGVLEEQGERRVRLSPFADDRGFEYAYVDHAFHAPLPFRPVLLQITADQQEDFLVFQVFAYLADGQSFLIDEGEVRDDEAFLELRSRPYHVLGEPDTPCFIYGGLIDCGDQRYRIFRLCLAAQDLGWKLCPSRGSGWNSNFRGKSIFTRTDYVDGREILVYEFYDHAAKSDFYINKIKKRNRPRLWIPSNVSRKTLAQWRAEKLLSKDINGRPVQVWDHNKRTDGPNDRGDTGKAQYIGWQILGPFFGNVPGSLAPSEPSLSNPP